MATESQVTKRYEENGRQISQSSALCSFFMKNTISMEWCTAKKKESINFFWNLHAVRFTFNPRLDDKINVSNVWKGVEKEFQMKQMLPDLECLPLQKSQEHTGVRPLMQRIMSVILCCLSTELNSFTSAELRGRKEMPTAFYIVFNLRHLHIQDGDRLVSVMPALLLICTAINYSCKEKGCSIKMWLYKLYT